MTNLQGKIEEHKKKFAEESARVRDEKGLAELRNEFLSRKKGCLTSLFEEMKSLSAAEKPRAGQLINEFKDHVQEKLALLGGERCVCELSLEVGVSVSAVSHQLRSLRTARLVTGRREGRHVHYRLADDHVVELVTAGFDHVREPAPGPVSTR